jgi:hypothetical protein
MASPEQILIGVTLSTRIQKGIDFNFSFNTKRPDSEYPWFSSAPPCIFEGIISISRQILLFGLNFTTVKRFYRVGQTQLGSF